MPTVSVTKPSGNLAFGGMFQPSMRVIELAVDYCGETTPSSLQDVIDGLEQNQNWAIAIGRPLGEPPTGFGAYNQFEIGTPADQTSAETTKRPFVVQSYTGLLDPGSNNVWRISIVLTLLVRNINDAEDFPGRNHSSVSITSQTRGVRAYRIGKMVPYSGTPAADHELMTPQMTWNATNERFDNTWITCSNDDIGGESVDINGEPLSMPIEQTSITLSFVIREPYYASYSDVSRTTNAMWTKWGKNPSEHLNKRNTTTLFGYDVGRLVVTAVNVTPLDMEFRRVDITLVDDEWYHFDQMPWSTAGTVPAIANECDDPDPDPEIDLLVWHNKYVLWVTPIVEGFDWVATDFPDDVWSFFTSAVTIP
jgi:hypothetical protein